MKKKILSFLLAIIISAMLFVPVQTFADTTENLAVESVQAGTAQLIDVKITAATALDVNTAKIIVNYDSKLELVSVTNGTALPNNMSQDVSAQENGKYIYLASSGTAQDALLNNGNVIFTMKFKTPAEAGTYSVKIDNARTELVNAEAVSTPCIAKSGAITASAPATTPCEAHTFGESVVVKAEATYLAGAYSYKTCTACGYVESTSTPPTSTGILTPLGTAIKYAGNPAGIGAHFKVDAEAIAKVEEAGYKITIGMEFVYGTREEKYYFYGDNISPQNETNFADGVISAGIENLYTQQKGTICAFVDIVDPAVGYGRTERVYNHLNGEKNLSIRDIAELLNFNKYSEATCNYLTAVLAGETFEDKNYIG